MTTPELTRFAARLSLHEFLLEQVLANAMLREPDPLTTWDDISRDLAAKIRFDAWSEADAPELQAVQTEAVVLAERFCAKVRKRIAQP